MIVNENVGSKDMHVLGTNITRSKTQNKSIVMRTYPEREEFMLDYHFTIA